jgi:hypothetical protein
MLMPLVHATGRWGTGTDGGISPWQGRTVEVIRDTCPFLGIVDAFRPAIKIDWNVLPGMYAYSGLGQEIPMTLPAWWASAGLYAGITAVIVLITILRRRRA